MTARIRLAVVAGQRFGRPGAGASVIDPELRLGRTERKPHGYRHARLRCDCGTEYLAQLSHLYAGRAQSCAGCSRKAMYARRRTLGGRVSGTAQRGFSVSVYVGWYKSEREARDVARRSRAVVVPESHFQAAAKTLT